MELSVKRKFDSYPKGVSLQLNKLRDLIVSTAEENGIDELTETLKWGEPSYTSNLGSAIRFDWKPKNPDQYCLYFNCKTSLIETFREVYGDTLSYDGYKKLKHLELLGA